MENMTDDGGLLEACAQEYIARQEGRSLAMVHSSNANRQEWVWAPLMHGEKQPCCYTVKRNKLYAHCMTLTHLMNVYRVTQEQLPDLRIKIDEIRTARKVAARLRGEAQPLTWDQIEIQGPER